MVQEPHHFTFMDFLRALFGSFIIGLSFLFAGSMFYYASRMELQNVIMVILLTFIIVSAEIYALSYKFVKNRKERPFHEFWAKRFFTITISAFVSLYIVTYIYGFNNNMTQVEMLKLISAVFLPASIGGAAIEVLKKGP